MDFAMDFVSESHARSGVGGQGDERKGECGGDFRKDGEAPPFDSSTRLLSFHPLTQPHPCRTALLPRRQAATREKADPLFALLFLPDICNKHRVVF